MKLALIGCGAIGRAIAGAVKGGVVEAEFVALYDSDTARSKKLAAFFEPEPRVCGDIKGVLESGAELVVEAASQEAVREYAPSILEAGKSLLVMSVGALLDSTFYEGLRDTAGANKVKVFIPSGAVGGLDALRAASLGNISEVNLVTTKHPSALAGSPYMMRKGIREVAKRTVIYEGSAVDAVWEFPANINVSAALSLAGIGAAKTRVTIVADPGVKRNVHEVTAEGDFGSFTLRFENLPSPENPRTSYLAALAAIATLKRLSSPVEIGT